MKKFRRKVKEITSNNTIMKKVYFTLGILAIYRLLIYIPVPFVDVSSILESSLDAGAAGGSDSVNVELTEAGQQKIAVIKVVKEVLGIDLKAAKDLVEAAPKIIKENVKTEEAEALKAKLTEAGATVNFK